jgi:dipeptidyl aminopeptidase/acylaminoacyl peptidase
MLPMRKPSTIWQALGAIACCLVLGSAAAQTAPPPVEAFFDKPATASAVISPNGRLVAITSLNKEKLLQLVVLDTASMSAKVVTNFRDADVVNVHWVNDKRLVFGAGDMDRRLSDMKVGQGLYAIDADGGEFRQLARVDWHKVDNDGRNSRLLDVTTRYQSSLLDADGDGIVVTQTHWKANGEFEALNLLKLDTRTGTASTYERPGETEGWVTDRKGNARFAVTRLGGGRRALQYFDGSRWTKLNDFDGFTRAGTFNIVDLAPDGTLYVTFRKGDGASALYTYDLARKQLADQPVLSVAGFDVRATLDLTQDALVGIHYSADARATYWIDPRLKQLQEKIDKLLPATVNALDVPYRAQAPYVLVHAYSDVDAGQYFLYDTKADKLVRFGRSRPAIDPAQMARRDFLRFKARDGLDIPAWITTPRNAKPGAQPMVVLVHGGPWVRGGEWEWEAQSQFLASRGYVVLEPEFRGSQGYGFKHFKAGWKEWGLAMQNDVADAARWAIGKGVADPKRICIAGASYGGYATLMGLANDPDLFRCGFEWVGVTDIELLYSISWSDFGQEYKEFGMPLLVGDREKDAAQLKATSPIQLAARIKQPLLMGYGGRDVRVPLKHGTEFRDAVQKNNSDVEWVVYADEGHGWSQLKDNVDWWTRVEKFLDRNIGAK